MTLIDAVHNAFTHHATSGEKLNNALGLLVADHGKDAAFAAVIECATIAYVRLHFTEEKLRARDAKTDGGAS